MGNPGMLVETKSGKKGRTYNNKPLVYGKVPVYLATEMKETGIPGLQVCSKFSDKGILCDPATLKMIGFID